MCTKVGIGKSNMDDSFKAGEFAAREAMNKAKLTTCDLVIVFSTVGFDLDQLLKGIRSVTKEATLVGGTGEGIITQSGPEGELMFSLSGTEIENESVGVMVISSDELNFQVYLEKGVFENSTKVGEDIAKNINNEMPDNPLVLLAFPDGYKVNMEQFYQGFESLVSKPLLIAGGLTGHNLEMSTDTYQFYDDMVLQNAVVAILISGSVNMEIGVNHGCLPIGLEKTVTRSKANILYEIENKPAWDFFQEYLGKDVDDFTSETAPALSLGIKLEEEFATEYDKYIIRAPFLKRDDGSIAFATEIPEGIKVRLVRRDEDRISNGAIELAKRLKDKLNGKKPKLVLHFDCAGRGKMFFGDRVKEMGIDVIQDVLGKDIPWFGFFAFGELAPIKGKNYFHNHTVALVVFY